MVLMPLPRTTGAEPVSAIAIAAAIAVTSIDVPAGRVLVDVAPQAVEGGRVQPVVHPDAALLRLDDPGRA